MLFDVGFASANAGDVVVLPVGSTHAEDTTVVKSGKVIVAGFVCKLSALYVVVRVPALASLKTTRIVALP